MARLGIVLSLLTIVAALAVVPVWAQMGDPTFENGLKPYGSYHGGDIDTVSLSNGKLDLHIPLYSYPQRGKLSLGFTIRYDNPRLSETKDEDCAVLPPDQCNYYSNFDSVGVTVSSDFPRSIYHQDIYVSTNHVGDVYSAVDADGAMHDLGSNTGSSHESADASGFHWDKITSVLIDRAGVRYYLSGNKIEDPNGNQITYNTTNGTFTDSVGRAIKAPPGPGGTSDSTGCTGPLAIYSANLWQIPGPQGGTLNVKFCYVQIQLNFNLQPGLNHNPAGGYAVMLQSIVLPNSTTWTFEYDNNGYGVLTKVTLPTGGTISWGWAITRFCVINGQYPINYALKVTSRTVDPQDGTGSRTWTYSLSEHIATPHSVTTIVTDPLQNDTVHFLTGLNDTCSYYETDTKYYQGSSTSGTLLKTVDTDYQWQQNSDFGQGHNPVIGAVPIRITTTLPVAGGNKISKVEKDYDSGFNFTDWGGVVKHAIYGNVVAEREYDYGSNAAGPLLRQTSKVYTGLSANYLTNNLLDLVYSNVVCSPLQSGETADCGTLKQRAATTFAYDQVALSSSGITTQHNSAPPDGSSRGNQTQVNRWLNTGGTLTTNRVFYDTGMVNTSTDPGGHTTTYAYSSTFAGAYLTQTTLPDTNSPNLAHHISSANYDFNTGLTASTTDENSAVTSYNYDNMWRIQTITPPSSGGVTTFTYTDTPGSLKVERTSQIDASRTTDEFVYFDGLGREKTRSVFNDESVAWDKTDICYDLDGRRSFGSYPYQASTANGTPNCTTGVGDTYAYDSLSRVTSVTHADSTIVTTSYTGATTMVIDEGNGANTTKKVSQVDGLGRLISVCEVTSTTLIGTTPTPAACGQDIVATGFLTSYQYDALGNLTGVTQGGLNARTFTYDSVSRLIKATNPESGTTCYGTWSGSNCLTGYDADGNLLQRTRPKPNQSSATVTVTATMTYDQLHRLRTVTYSDTTVPTTVNYDETTALGVGLANTIGRKSSEFTGPSATKISGSVYSNDNMGRVVNNSQCTPQNCATGTFPFVYQYDLLGDIKTSTNGIGTTLTYAYNRAARPTSLTSSLSNANHPATLMSAIHYNAFGSDLSDSLGNGINDTFLYTTRGWLRSRQSKLGTTIVHSYTITNPGGQSGYSPNGNVLYVNDSTNGNWSFTYDDMNRLITSNKNSGAQSFTYVYDRFGNRWQQNALQGGPAPQYSFDTNNRIVGSSMVYDAAGNITNDGTHSYNYDAENRIAQVDAGATGTYIYDASGARVRKTTSSGTVDYLYDLAGHQVSELSSTGTWNRGEVYMGTRHIAVYSGGAGGTTYFPLSDWLGTERLRSNVSGASCETVTSLPYGDLQTTGGSCGDPSPMHFTGKQRDTETGLDDFPARYYSSIQGRWMSPDWSPDPVPIPFADLNDPRTLNLYDYVGDDPTNHPDADGHRNVPGQEANAACDGNTECAANKQKQEEQKTQGANTLPIVVPLVSDSVAGKVVKALVTTAVEAVSVTTVTVAVTVAYLISPNSGAVNERQDTIQKGGPKAADAPGVTAGGQATDEHGSKRGPSGDPQVDRTRSNTREGAGNRALNEGSGKVEHANPRRGEPHFHPADNKGDKKPNSTHHEYPR